MKEEIWNDIARDIEESMNCGDDGALECMPPDVHKRHRITPKIPGEYLISASYATITGIERKQLERILIYVIDAFCCYKQSFIVPGSVSYIEADSNGFRNALSYDEALEKYPELVDQEDNDENIGNIFTFKGYRNLYLYKSASIDMFCCFCGRIRNIYRFAKLLIMINDIFTNKFQKGPSISVMNMTKNETLMSPEMFLQELDDLKKIAERKDVEISDYLEKIKIS